MKNSSSLKLLLSLVILVTSKSYYGQVNICGTPTASRPVFLSQPTNSVQILKDIAPTGNDKTIEINVNFIVFVPAYTSSLTSSWTHSLDPTTLNDAQTALNNANTTYSSIPLTPQLTVPGMTLGITDAKIKLVLKNFQYVTNDACYLSIGNAAYGNFGYNGWYDPNAINIILGTETTTSNPTGTLIVSNYIGGSIAANWTPGTGFDNIIRFNPELFHTSTGTNSRRDNIKHYGASIAHEVGHILGLWHLDAPYTSTVCGSGDGLPYIISNFGCVSYSEANDVAMETYNCYNQIPFAGCNTIGASDNIMSSNSGCYRYLSPQQAGIIHYNLRTILKHLLKSTGYTDATSRNSSFDYNVTSNETWQNGDRYFKGDINVKAGKTLTIKCGVAMTHGARILVEPSALLVVDGGTVTNISGRTWDGIYVWGDPLYSQAISNGMPVYQGMAKFINGAVISHAKIGVRNYYDPYFLMGGIIIGANSSFLNNEVDLDFQGNKKNSVSPNAISTSKFYNCTFKTTGLIGDNLHPQQRVNLFKSVGVRFYGCDFEFDADSVYPYSNGKGIYSVDSKFIVDKNGASPTAFKSLGYGVHINNSNPLLVPTIINCEFIDNIGYGAYFINANNLVFQNNLIRNPVSAIPWCGVYLNNCKYYTIKNNSFFENLSYTYKNSPGIEIHNSGAGAHQVYKNSFSNLSIGINAMGDNSGLLNTLDGLKLNCNDFTQTPNYYDIALNLGAWNAAPSVMKDQGAITNQNSGNLVRNMYAATCTGNGNQWYIHSSSTKTVNHGSNSQSFTKPLPHPSCSRTIVTVVTSSISLNYTLDCGSGLQSSGGTSTISSNRLSNMNDYLTSIGTSDHFERQATVASKLNLFLTDTLDRMDSVIAILQNNQGNMADADIQTVFAYMAQGNYAEAILKKNALGSGKTDWKDLLTELITLEQDTVQGIYKLQSNSTLRQFFVDRATSDKDGNYIAMALLKAACDSNYTEPHNYPEGSGLRNAPGSENTEEVLTDTAENNLDIEVYPNPAQNGITIHCNLQGEAPCEIELRDLLGKLIYANFISSSNRNHYMAMDELSIGMYLVIITQNKKVIYKTKIIKEN